jgi:tetratricopeptide (TPR) repeat protein
VLRVTWVRRIFLGASAILVLIASARVAPALSALNPDLGAAQIAAERYATGVVNSETGDLDEAISNLQAAIDARPTFTQAYTALARAMITAGTPQSSSNVSLDTPEMRRETIDILRQAVANGAESSEAALDLGFLLYRDAMSRDDIDHRLLSESIGVTQRSIAGIAPSRSGLLAIAHSNLGVAYIAAGRPEDAARAYDDVVRTIHQAPNGSLTASDYGREQILSGALTDLDNLAMRHASTREAAEGMKAYLVGRIWPATPSNVLVSELAIDLRFPSLLVWTAQATAGFDEATVVVQWYRKAESGEWFVLPDVSGKAGSGFVEVSPDSNAAGRYFGTGTMTASRVLRCLVDGESYRLEVYVDGKLASTAMATVTRGDELPIEAAEMQAVDAVDIGLAFCLPTGWKRIEQKVALVVGYGDPDRSSSLPVRGMWAFRVHRPQSPAGQNADISAAVAQVLSSGAHATFLPSLEPDGEEQPIPFYGLASVSRYYKYLDDGSDGYALIKAIAQDDGSISVVVILGVVDDFDKSGDLGLVLAQTMLRHN